MKGYWKDRAIGGLSFAGDFALGAFIFAFLVGQSYQLFAEVLGLIEALTGQFRINALGAHCFVIYALTLTLRALFALFLGRSPGDMAVGRVAFRGIRERLRSASLNLLLIICPPLCLLPDPRRRLSFSWSFSLLLVMVGVLWPWPMLWSLSKGVKLKSVLVSRELQLDVNKGNFSQSVVFESQLFGLEALSENPETLAMFPCPQLFDGGVGKGVPTMCFYDLASNQWLTLSMPELFTMQAPLARYLEFSRLFTSFGPSNIPDLTREAMELGPYDGIKSALAHGPFLEGILHFKLFLYQLTEARTSSGEETRLQVTSLVKIGGRDFFQVQTESDSEWTISLFPLEMNPAPMLRLSGPKRSEGLRERFYQNFVSSIKWEKGEGEGMGGLCDFVFSGKVLDGDLEKVEDAVIKLYASLSTVAIKQKSVGLKRLLLRSFLQFKHAKNNKISMRLEKAIDGISTSLNADDSRGLETWK